MSDRLAELADAVGTMEDYSDLEEMAVGISDLSRLIAIVRAADAMRSEYDLVPPVLSARAAAHAYDAARRALDAT